MEHWQLLQIRVALARFAPVLPESSGSWTELVIELRFHLRTQRQLWPGEKYCTLPHLVRGHS